MRILLFLILMVLLFGREAIIGAIGVMFWTVVVIAAIIILLYLLVKSVESIRKVSDSLGVTKFLKDCRINNKESGPAILSLAFWLYIFIVPRISFVQNMHSEFLTIILVIVASLLTLRFIRLLQRKK